MISIDIKGGLGNQLFMIFATLAYGFQYNVQIVFPYHKGSHNRGTYWDTLFDHLQSFITYEPTNTFQPYSEPTFSYSPIPDFGNQNTFLIGYFQNPQYFESHRNEIYQLLHLYDKKRDIIKRHRSLFDKKTVSIHFRMGDYKQKRYYHPIMNYEYFETSLQHVLENGQVERVLYLCEQEDNEYVGKQIKRLEEKYPQLEFTKVDDAIPDYDQLLIMACCDHNIMSNSTFSWWGAYLNENPHKIVTYPSVWFGEYFEHTHDYKDIMETHWKMIEAHPIPWQHPL